MLKKISLPGCLAAVAVSCLSPLASAVDFDVTVSNVSRGLFFTPLVVSAHTEDARLFTAGEEASAELQAMAEGGSIAGLADNLTALNATMSNNPAEGLLLPGQSATTTLNTDEATDNIKLSIAGMILPSNDGFIALNTIDIPTEAGTYTFFANAYDAGTEANDEIRGGGAPGVAGFPVPPPMEDLIGNGGTGLNVTSEGFVHIHRGSLGDADSEAGISDINNGVQRWLNPVAKITLTVR